MTETKMQNPVCHFEIPFDDAEKAKDFYSIFNWEINDIPGMDYVGIQTTSTDDNKIPIKPGGINGGMMKRTEEVKHPVFAVHVDSVDAYLEKVVEKGGKVVMPKMQISNLGYYAYIADPEGNVLGIWETL